MTKQQSRRCHAPQATALLPCGIARLTLGHVDVSPAAQQHAPLRLSGLLEVELPNASARADASQAAAGMLLSPDAARAKQMAASRVDVGTDAALLQTQHCGADAAASPGSGTADGAATTGGAAPELVSATAAPVWLPAPLSQPQFPLASLVGTSSAVRASAEAACQRSPTTAEDRAPQSGPDPRAMTASSNTGIVADRVVRRAIAAVRAAGARGLSHQALSSYLLSPSSVQTEAPARQTDDGDDRPHPGQPAASAGPTPSAGSAATRTRVATVAPLLPDPAEMAAAADALRPLLHHGLVRRVPGFNHVAYVASEHSQRYLLLPPCLPAHTLPGPAGPSAPVAPAGTTAMPGNELARGAASASEDGVSTAAEPQVGVPQQAPQAPSGALDAEASASAATASDQRNTPSMATLPQPVQPAGRTHGVQQRDGGRPSATAAPRVAPREQVIRPWLDHAGGVNVPLWRDLTAKAVTLVLRHPGAGCCRPLCQAAGFHAVLNQ